MWASLTMYAEVLDTGSAFLYPGLVANPGNCVIV